MLEIYWHTDSSKKYLPEITLVTLVMEGWPSMTLVTLVMEGWPSMTLVTLVMVGSPWMTLVTLVTSGTIKEKTACFTTLKLQLAQHCPSIRIIFHLYADNVTNGSFTGSERLLWKCDSQSKDFCHQILFLHSSFNCINCVIFLVFFNVWCLLSFQMWKLFFEFWSGFIGDSFKD